MTYQVLYTLIMYSLLFEKNIARLLIVLDTCRTICVNKKKTFKSCTAHFRDVADRQHYASCSEMRLPGAMIDRQHYAERAVK